MRSINHLHLNVFIGVADGTFAPLFASSVNSLTHIVLHTVAAPPMVTIQEMLQTTGGKEGEKGTTEKRDIY